ncbi:hypothetical protein SAMN05444483_101342 [Salegentibacter echinorum]|uniref:Thioredoxin domain-containing protein n=1 Tax=Salegentibacter echinorum TaxID=1073325 RepID=A0A1M5C592_SALEC|nr:hypothetical protein [Salegentibacter echinorum]SHF49777.1 hypothetical protein SAMN05444483_101342 [Salegentibacter echinorum]
MKFRILFLIGAMLLWSCEGSKEEQATIFVGGQIMNPYNDLFILSKDRKVIDTLRLDNNNQFGKQFKDLKPGIYTFKHPPETQIMYLEPGDSILVWLNTMQFDESLNFSGKGAAKSSFLLDMFLKNEKTNNLMLSYYKIKPDEFARITDSIKQERRDKLETMEKSKQFSSTFKNLASASIDYDYYHLRERYTFLVKKYYNELAQQIPKDFLDYRENLDFNNMKLKEYYGYLNFIEDFLRTRSIEHCLENPQPDSDCFELNSFKNISFRMNLADSLIEKKELKSIFINRLAIQGIIFSDNTPKIDSILTELDEIEYEYAHLPEIKQMAKIQKNLLPGNNIGDLKLMDYAGKEVSLSKISNKPTITYHWSLQAPEHFKWQHKLIASLREKYPEINFVGINIDSKSNEVWKEIIDMYGYKKDWEFKLDAPEINPDLLRNYLNKLVFLSAKGEIINGKAQLNTPNFERQILEFLNE